MIEGVVCESCESETFEIDTNSAENMRVSCSDCGLTVAFGWETSLHDLKPRSEMGDGEEP